MIIVLDNADPWVGTWSEAYGPHEFTADNHIMEMMVYKSVISNCGIKLEVGTGENQEVMVPNTKINEWELLTFDLSAAVGLINLFPIPVLDGGHLIFYAYEAVTRRKPNERAVQVFMFVGLALIL